MEKVFKDYKSCKYRRNCEGCAGALICTIDENILNKIVEYVDSLQKALVNREDGVKDEKRL